MSQTRNWWNAGQQGPQTPVFPNGVVNRAPLAPFPQPINYDDTLWFPPPPVANQRYVRANFGCVTIPGLPWVPGMESKNFDRLLTGFYGRYDEDWQQTIATTYYERGYTHFMRWVQDELVGNGTTVDQYIEQCLRLKRAGVAYILHAFLSKDYSPLNPDSQFCHEEFDWLIDELRAHELLDGGIVGFEMNLFMQTAESIQACIDYFCVEQGMTEASGCPMYVHFQSEYTWPGIGAPDRRQWWNLWRYKLTGLCYQNNPSWEIKDAQDRYKDTTDNPGEGFVGTDSGFGHPFDFVAFETQLEEAFGDNASLDENDLDQFGYLSLCTAGGVPVMGFGNGARRPDGSYV